MNKLILALSLLALPAMAQSRPQVFSAVTPENIPTVAGAVSNQFVSTSTVTSVTVPYFSDNYIMSGDPLWVCDNIARCGTTFPTSSVSVTGWVFNPSGRVLKGNLQVSTSLIYVYARPQDMVSGTSTSQNIGAFEWSCRSCPQ